MGVLMKMIKRLVRSISFWIFIVVAFLGGLGAIISIPLLGEAIAALTILGVTIQGVEAVHTQEEIEQGRHEAAKQHAEALQQIKQAREVAESQIKQAREVAESQIEQTRHEAASQHDQALQQIKQARQEAAGQYADAVRAINKARDEARAEDILLRADKFAASLREKDELVNEAIALCPDFKQEEWTKLGIEMGRAVIANADHIEWQYLHALRLVSDSPLLRKALGPEERTYFIEHAIQYLTETVGQATDADAVVCLVYLACMLGCAQRYDDMMLALDKARQINPIVPVMDGQFRKQPMLFLLLDACGSDQSKFERVWETLDLPRFTEQHFRTYITEHYPQSDAYRHRHYSEWAAVTRPDAIRGRDMHSALIKIALEGEPADGKTSAFFGPPNRSTEDIVPPGEPVSVEDLYRKLSKGFILFCPLN